MSFLTHASIRTKILALIIPVCLVGVGGISYVSYKFNAADQSYSDFISTDAIAANQMARTPTSFLSLGYDVYQAISRGKDAPQLAELTKDYDSSRQTVYDRMEKALKLTPENKAAITDFKNRADMIFAHTDEAMAALKAGQIETARQKMAQADPLIASIRGDIREYNNKKIDGIAKRSDDLSAITDNSIFYSLTSLGVLFTIAIVAALLVAARGITGPIQMLRDRMITLANNEIEPAIPGLDRHDEIGGMAQSVSVFRDNAIERKRLEEEAEANRSLSEKERLAREEAKAREAADVKFAVDTLATALQNLSDGDVSYRISDSFAGTLDTVRNNFNASAEKLQTALSQVANNALAIEAGANEIKAAADDLAKRTEQQAASVEETAAALEEITTTVKDSTRRAKEAGQLVASTREGAEQSGAVVRQAVLAMEQIEKSSGEISNIISVIDEIAFQTNLLALNAGVEAARAGEAGKGFAVVAQEVRELAQRSASAAKDIKALITTSNDQVQQGVKLVGETGRALETIVAQVQDINRNVIAIVEAAQEQSSGLGEINTAVNQMDQDTQKNAAMVEESTAASHGLAREVASLNQLLSQFKLKGTHQAASPPLRSASQMDRPVSSPVKALGKRIANAFTGKQASAAAAASNSWEEF
ncbi:methyl-accepting chemotaxis protein [Allorhizobium sp. BGMRC 0089]|uniref:HAMP domain-containing methyl-accepting chemotaxis protein n=1 Tax=Allorhizobium sonneratiae TaxID=2934936 RepID=UPI00203483E4|nr:methyl-accepting chemotaxis protein [Allorhizobium sonneratiae]MCM2291819.1 methyl-accepting chemotaxis protein [Allorhizobium sonneratiae]